MTSKEFILWLKGFTEGVHEFNISPKQWDILKDKLAEVKDEPTPITYNPSTTTKAYPSGSAWSYTNNTGNNRWNEYQATMAQYRPYQPYTTGGEDEVIKHHNED